MLTEFLVTKKQNKLKWYKINVSQNEREELKHLERQNIIPPWKGYERLKNQIKTNVFTCEPDETQKENEELILVDMVLKKLDEIESVLFGQVSKESKCSESYVYKSSLDYGSGLTCWRSNLIKDKSISFSIHDKEKPCKPKEYIIQPKEEEPENLEPLAVLRPSSPTTFPLAPPLPLDLLNQPKKPRLALSEKNDLKTKKKQGPPKIPNDELLEQIRNSRSKLKKVPIQPAASPERKGENDDGLKNHSFKIKLNNLKQTKQPNTHLPNIKLITFNVYNKNDSFNQPIPTVYECQSQTGDQFKNVLVNIFFNLERLCIDHKNKMNKKSLKIPIRVKSSEKQKLPRDAPDFIELSQATTYDIIVEDFNIQPNLHKPLDPILIIDENSEKPISTQLPLATESGENSSPKPVQERKFSEMADSILRRAKANRLSLPVIVPVETIEAGSNLSIPAIKIVDAATEKSVPLEQTRLTVIVPVETIEAGSNLPIPAIKIVDAATEKSVPLDQTLLPANKPALVTMKSKNLPTLPIVIAAPDMSERIKANNFSFSPPRSDFMRPDELTGQNKPSVFLSNSQKPNQMKKPIEKIMIIEEEIIPSSPFTQGSTRIKTASDPKQEEKVDFSPPVLKDYKNKKSNSSIPAIVIVGTDLINDAEQHPKIIQNQPLAESNSVKSILMAHSLNKHSEITPSKLITAIEGISISENLLAVPKPKFSDMASSILQNTQSKQKVLQGANEELKNTPAAGFVIAEPTVNSVVVTPAKPRLSEMQASPSQASPSQNTPSQDSKNEEFKGKSLKYQDIFSVMPNEEFIVQSDSSESSFDEVIENNFSK